MEDLLPGSYVGLCVLIVALALVSAVVSGTYDKEPFILWVPGLMFGLAIIGGSFVRFEKVGLLRMLLVAGSSLVANYAAVQSFTFVGEIFESNYVGGGAAGLIGGALLGVGLSIAYRLRPVSRTAAFLGAVGAGLGILFFIPEDLRISYAIWQAGMAAAIAHAWRKKSA